MGKHGLFNESVIFLKNQIQVNRALNNVIYIAVLSGRDDRMSYKPVKSHRLYGTSPSIDFVNEKGWIHGASVRFHT